MCELILSITPIDYRIELSVDIYSNSDLCMTKII